MANDVQFAVGSVVYPVLFRVLLAHFPLPVLTLRVELHSQFHLSHHSDRAAAP